MRPTLAPLVDKVGVDITPLAVVFWTEGLAVVDGRGDPEDEEILWPPLDEAAADDLISDGVRMPPRSPTPSEEVTIGVRTRRDDGPRPRRVSVMASRIGNVRVSSPDMATFD